MQQIFIKSKAKINLTLNILGTRLDGYHELESIFQSIYLYDEIYIEKSGNENIKIICNNKSLETDNIIHKAYSKLKERYPQIKGIIVKLNKKIPIEAGVGGGSSDCAYFILAMNKLFDLNMTKESLIELGVSLGADVVPCMVGNTMIGRGLGEKITYIQDASKYYIVLIKPDISLNTKEMFKKFDSLENIMQENNTNNMIKALEQNNISDISKNLYNAFEETVKDENEILKSKEQLINLGADGVLMTGAGSAVFGIFEDKKTAKRAYYEIQKEKQVYFCIPYHSKKFKEMQ